MLEIAGRRSIGCYELLAVLGRGGMGVVHKAKHITTGRIVALKVASRMVVNDPVLSKRFAREYSIAATLDHPNLVKIFEYGMDGEILYLVMEFVEGLTLHQLLRKQGPLSLDEARPIFRQLCDAIAYLHDRNIFHRDIKPGNLVVDASGQAKLIDLGLLKSDDRADLLTHSEIGLGTVDFAPPEQFDDAKRVDARSDVYSLGATLYVALTGKNPFGDGGHMKVLARKLGYQFIPLSDAKPGIDPAIDRIVNRCLHPDPNQRPGSIDEIRAALQTDLGNRDSALESATDKETPEPEFRPMQPPSSRIPRESRRSETRYPLNLRIHAEPMGRIAMAQTIGTILDISQGGVCLQFPRYIATGSILKVWVPSDQVNIYEDEDPVMVRVAWIKSQPGGSYQAGCAFLQPIGTRQLERILHRDSSTTKNLEGQTRSKQPDTNARDADSSKSN